jgi:ubiquitin-activating enzyme E1 C
VKLLTFAGQSLNTYLMYMGSDGLYCNTWECLKNDSCLVCGSAMASPLTVSPACTVSELLQKLNDDFQLAKASVMSNSGAIYMRNPPPLEVALRPNLEKCLRDLISSGDVLSVVDPALCGKTITMKIIF